MKIFFRVDASFQMGTGHLIRCLTLADEILSYPQTEIHFICNKLPEDLKTLVLNKGVFLKELACFKGLQEETSQTLVSGDWGEIDWDADANQVVEVLQNFFDIDLVVVDHYGLDLRWEKRIRPFAKKMLVIDDMANRHHFCDLLLDQNFYQNLDHRYDDLLPPNCIQLLGPKYALLRPEFREARKKMKIRDGNVRNVLIFFSGSDPTKETLKALNAIQILNRPNIHFDVVVGGANPLHHLILERCNALPCTTCHYQIDYMASLLVQADLAIGAGGTAAWERCYLGLPSLTIVVSDNQYESLTTLSKLGATVLLGRSPDIRADDLVDAIQNALAKPEVLRNMSKVSLELMGEALTDSNLVTQKIMEITLA